MTYSYEEKILELVKPHKVVMIYAAKADELETKHIINMLLENKMVVLPRVKDKNIMITKRIKSLNDLEVGRFGVLEPTEECETVNKNQIDIFIIPGREFDVEGNRRGRGLGYFDRFLSDVKVPIVGVCRDDYLKQKIKVNEWDIPVTHVVTDKRYKNTGWVPN